MDKKVISFDRWLALATGIVLLTFAVYAFSFLIHDETDWRILLSINPDSYIPIIEELMVFLSDFSIFLFGIMFFSWEVAYQVSKHSQRSRFIAGKTLKVIGIIFACVSTLGFFWQRFEHSMLFFPFAFLVFAGFRFIGNTFGRYPEEKLKQINLLFWITLLSTLLVEFSAEIIIKEVVGRPRPLSGAYSTFNWGIRRVADEVVITGYSYVAGHSATFFGMITPMVFYVSKNGIKTCLFLWALVHSFSRVYVAAHFLFCSLMGSVLGFSIGMLTIMVFGMPKDNIKFKAC